MTYDDHAELLTGKDLCGSVVIRLADSGVHGSVHVGQEPDLELVAEEG